MEWQNNGGDVVSWRFNGPKMFIAICDRGRVRVFGFWHPIIAEI